MHFVNMALRKDDTQIREAFHIFFLLCPAVHTWAGDVPTKGGSIKYNWRFPRGSLILRKKSGGSLIMRKQSGGVADFAWHMSKIFCYKNV